MEPNVDETVIVETPQRDDKVNKKTPSPTNIWLVISVSLNILVLVGCVIYAYWEFNRIENISSTIDKICEDVNQNSLNAISLKNDVTQITGDILDLSVKDISLGIDMEKYAKVDLDLSEMDTYSRVDTVGGKFFIIVENSEKYLDGYKVNLSIGNPQYCTYNGFDILAEWNRPYSSSESVAEWDKSKKEKKISQTIELSEGKWTSCSIILTPMSDNETHNLKIKMSTSSIILNK